MALDCYVDLGFILYCTFSCKIKSWGARPHPMTVALATGLVKIDRIDRFHFSVYERAQRETAFPRYSRH